MSDFSTFLSFFDKILSCFAESLFFPLVTGRDEGSGLGLAIAQEIVDRHGGRIEFESEPGDTVFRLLLPVPE